MRVKLFLKERKNMPENNKLRYDSYTESPKGHLNNITFTASVKKLGDVYAEATPITALTSHGDFVGGIAGVTAMGRQLGVDVGFIMELKRKGVDMSFLPQS